MTLQELASTSVRPMIRYMVPFIKLTTQPELRHTSMLEVVRSTIPSDELVLLQSRIELLTWLRSDDRERTDGRLSSYTFAQLKSNVCTAIRI